MANAFLVFTLKLRHLLPFTEEHSLFKIGSGTGDIRALESDFVHNKSHPGRCF